MTPAVLTREAVNVPRPLSQMESELHVNALGVGELFALYERVGFLYPSKAARLKPHLKVVQENWRRVLQAGDSLMYVLTVGDTRQDCASVAIWMTKQDRWVWQTLVRKCTPLISRMV